MNRNIIVFIGPSGHGLTFPDHLDIRPPAKLGDLASENFISSDVIVLIDSVFFQLPPPTHLEILGLLYQKNIVIGASSTGALRAVELEKFGMLGVGKVFSALKKGLITDDAELAVNVNPQNHQALTIPLINIRKLLWLALAKYNCPSNHIEKAFRIAKEIHYSERTANCLSTAWEKDSTSIHQTLKDIIDQEDYNVKKDDALRAVELALELISTTSDKKLSSWEFPIMDLYKYPSPDNF